MMMMDRELGMKTYGFSSSPRLVARDVFDCALDLDEVDGLGAQLDYASEDRLDLWGFWVLVMEMARYWGGRTSASLFLFPVMKFR